MNSQPKSNNPRKTRSEWMSLVTDAEQSSLPAATFCEQQGLPYKSFMKWRSTFRSEKNQTKKQFLEITPKNSTSSPAVSSQNWDVELVLGCNVVLRIRQST